MHTNQRHNINIEIHPTPLCGRIFFFRMKQMNLFKQQNTSLGYVRYFTFRWGGLAFFFAVQYTTQGCVKRARYADKDS